VVAYSKERGNHEISIDRKAYTQPEINASSAQSRSRAHAKAPTFFDFFD
jgi:hypothetical protein